MKMKIFTLISIIAAICFALPVYSQQSSGGQQDRSGTGSAYPNAGDDSMGRSSPGGTVDSFPPADSRTAPDNGFPGSAGTGSGPGETGIDTGAGSIGDDTGLGSTGIDTGLPGSTGQGIFNGTDSMSNANATGMTGGASTGRIGQDQGVSGLDRGQGLARRSDRLLRQRLLDSGLDQRQSEELMNEFFTRFDEETTRRYNQHAEALSEIGRDQSLNEQQRMEALRELFSENSPSTAAGALEDAGNQTMNQGAIDRSNVTTNATE